MIMNTNHRPHNQGFTLLEMLVAVFIFSIVATVAAGSIVSMIDANQKARSIKAVMNNLNLALEAMSRDIRFGQGYETDPASCTLSRPCSIKIKKGGDISATASSRDITYSLQNNLLMKKIGSATNGNVITSNEVVIERLFFRVFRPTADGRGQRVLVLIGGKVVKGNIVLSTFNLQTTVTQRNL
jgi:prepilin-type N-terminal cleavage/methylation domain-containing protein